MNYLSIVSFSIKLHQINSPLQVNEVPKSHANTEVLAPNSMTLKK